MSRFVSKGLPLIGAAVAVMALAAACSFVNYRTLQYVGVERFPPSDPAKVVIMHAPPPKDVPVVKLGEVIVDASIDPQPKIGEIEAAIRKGAAQMGADAAVLVYDRSQVMGAVYMGPWWAPSMSPVRDRLVVAVAIRHKAPPPPGDRR